MGAMSAPIAVSLSGRTDTASDASSSSCSESSETLSSSPAAAPEAAAFFLSIFDANVMMDEGSEADAAATMRISGMKGLVPSGGPGDAQYWSMGTPATE